MVNVFIWHEEGRKKGKKGERNVSRDRGPEGRDMTVEGGWKDTHIHKWNTFLKIRIWPTCMPVYHLGAWPITSVYIVQPLS